MNNYSTVIIIYYYYNHKSKLSEVILQFILAAFVFFLARFRFVAGVIVEIIFILYTMNQKDKFLLELANQHRTGLKKEFATLEKKKIRF